MLLLKINRAKLHSDGILWNWPSFFFPWLDCAFLLLHLFWIWDQLYTLLVLFYASWGSFISSVIFRKPLSFSPSFPQSKDFSRLLLRHIRPSHPSFAEFYVWFRFSTVKEMPWSVLSFKLSPLVILVWFLGPISDLPLSLSLAFLSLAAFWYCFQISWNMILLELHSFSEVLLVLWQSMNWFVQSFFVKLPTFKPQLSTFSLLPF